MKDFEFTVQYEGQEPLELNTHHIQEDVLRMKVGLEPHMETIDCYDCKLFVQGKEDGTCIHYINNDCPYGYHD